MDDQGKAFIKHWIAAKEEQEKLDLKHKTEAAKGWQAISPIFTGTSTTTSSTTTTFPGQLTPTDAPTFHYGNYGSQLVHLEEVQLHQLADMISLRIMELLDPAGKALEEKLK